MNQSWTIYLDLDAGSYVIQDGQLFREEPGGTCTPVGRADMMAQRGCPARIKETGVLAVPMPEERKCPPTTARSHLPCSGMGSCIGR